MKYCNLHPVRSFHRFFHSFYDVFFVILGVEIRCGRVTTEGTLSTSLLQIKFNDCFGMNFDTIRFAVVPHSQLFSVFVLKSIQAS